MARLYVSNRDESVRIFRNPLLEKFTHVHPATPHLIFVPVILWSMWVSIRSGIGPMVWVWLAAGVILWSITEYCVHRFVFHVSAATEEEVRRTIETLPQGAPVLPSLSGFEQIWYFLAHGVHHDFPNDSRRLVMPPSVSVPLAVFFYFAFSLLFGGVAPAVFAGFVAGYLFYDTTHFAVHHFRQRTRLGRYLKKHHFRHHYDDPERDFGVSSPIWDVVFRTRGRFGAQSRHTVDA